MIRKNACRVLCWHWLPRWRPSGPTPQTLHSSSNGRSSFRRARLPATAPKTFFSGVTPKSDDGAPPPPPLPEGKFMSLKRQQPGGGAPPVVVAELDGKRVKIGGYVVPLDFEATSIKEFLLVPFVGACIHVPPPPANQIIYVKAARAASTSAALSIRSRVTGTIKTETAFTGLADAGYSITAEAVELIKP